MRAGTLSDPRVVALLRKHFVAVEMTELCTEDLIEDPEDVALLKKYHKQSGDRFHGGEREAFFTPDGTLVDVFLTLGCGDSQRDWNGHTYKGQYSLSERADPKDAVRRFFRAAADTLRKTHGRLPDDFTALRDGTAPEVEVVRRLVPTLPDSTAKGLALRVMVRADVAMYEQLVGSDLVTLDETSARRLLPEALQKDTTQAWPRDTFVAVLRLAYPRGGGVYIDLAPDSVRGRLESRVTAVDDTTVRGTIHGTFELAPQTVRERSRRESYKPWEGTSGDLVGDFTWDKDTRRFTQLRVVSEDARSAFRHGKNPKRNAHRVGVELVRHAP